MHNKLQIVVFDVGAGQSILIYPSDQPDHAMLIDCGGEENGFSPVEFLVSKNILPVNGQGFPKLGGLAITNYDHDHFSWLPDLWQKIQIWTVRLPKNITSQELKNHKEEETSALSHLCHLKDTYVHDASYFKPIYNIYSDHLMQNDLDGEINTNHLSQIIFIEYGNSKICIAGDLERLAWEKMLSKPFIQSHLMSTNILVAPHHGRDNGYHENIFNFCNPEVILISDKEIMYDTQDGMVQKYASHVKTSGISFGMTNRKVITTRNEGHILIEFYPGGIRNYDKLAV
jgi:beta-lactamase superfamily II metal-dependent hydrolase